MQTAYMALNVTGAATFYSKKMVSVLPSCAYYPNQRYYNQYPVNDEITGITEKPAELLYEDEFENGLPHPSVECHGLAKRILFDYSRQLHKQYKFNAVCCVLNNCYGPGARYDEPDRLKVLDSLIQRFILAKRNNDPNISIWGTGNPLREFMYAKDAADGILHVFKHYDDATSVINIGPGHEISIKDLAYLVKDLVGYNGEITFDVERPDGQMRKKLDCSKIGETGWRPEYSLENGIKETISWYNDNFSQTSKRKTNEVSS
jgi:nucleoside-diphosphate-sugar epimerase